jgi:hypothetical protein
MFSPSFGLQLLLYLCLLSVFQPAFSNYKQAKYFSLMSQRGEEYLTYNKKEGRLNGLVTSCVLTAF